MLNNRPNGRSADNQPTPTVTVSADPVAAPQPSQQTGSEGSDIQDASVSDERRAERQQLTDLQHPNLRDLFSLPQHVKAELEFCMREQRTFFYALRHLASAIGNRALVVAVIDALDDRHLHSDELGIDGRVNILGVTFPYTDAKQIELP